MAPRSAIVTGSTSGIGLGIARRFAEAGWNVMMNGFGDPEDVEQCRSTLDALAPARVIHSGADMSKPEEIQAMCAHALDAFGHVDILVNNAGIQHVEKVEAFPIDKWDAIIAINLTSAFHTIRDLIGPMKQRGWGRIINVASAHGLVASPYKSAYVSAKHGIMGLTKTVALEAARDGVTCNAICPGYVRTPLVESQIPEQAASHGMSEEEVIEKVMLDKQPTKTFVDVGELAELAFFLCGDAARNINGTALSVDGGWVAE